MFPLKIGRWSTLCQGRKPLCKRGDKYQNMVLTLCRKSPNMYSKEIPKHLFIRVGTATWNSLHQGSLLPAGAVWDPTDAFGAGAQHPHPKAASLNITGLVQFKEAPCSYSWQAVLGALAVLGNVALKGLMACDLHVWSSLGTQVWKKKA